MCIPRQITAMLALAALLVCRPSGGADEPAAEVPPPPRFAALRAELAEQVASGEIPSAAIGVLSRGEIVWLEAMGWADREQQRPATVATPYGLASLGKSVTATAVMTLVEAGTLDLDRTFNSYAGNTPLFSPVGHADPATVRQVMNMTAAIPHGYYSYFHEQDARRLTAEGLVRERGLVALPPGQAHVYSNFAYAALELLIERLSGSDYATYLARAVFAPLGMEQAIVAPSTAPESAAARYGRDGLRLEPGFPRPASSLGMHASVQDLLRYARLHLGSLEEGQLPILGRDSLESMHGQRASLPASPAPPLTALGWGSVELQNGDLWLLSNGRSGGAQATLTLLPSEGLAVVVLVNATGGAADQLTFRIADRLVPGFLDEADRKREQWEASAHRRYEPTTELLGSWAGSIETPSGPLPLRLAFQADGDIHVELANGYPTLLSGVAWREGLLRGRFLGELPLEERAGRPHRIDLVLLPRSEAMHGWAQAIFANEQGRFMLPAGIELRREPPDAPTDR